MVSITDLFYGSTPTPQGLVSTQTMRAQPKPPPKEKTFCYIVYDQKHQLTQNAINWYRANNISITPCNGGGTTNGALESRVKALETLATTYEQPTKFLGKDYASQKSDADLWAHLDEHVWSNPPYDNPNAIKPTLDRAVKEHEGFNVKFQDLGDALVSAQSHRTSLEQKIETQRTHTHNAPPPPNGCDCDFWDISCKWNCGWEKYGTVVMIVGGLIGLGILLWLLRPLFSVLGIFKGGSP